MQKTTTNKQKTNNIFLQIMFLRISDTMVILKHIQGHQKPGIIGRPQGRL